MKHTMRNHIIPVMPVSLFTLLLLLGSLNLRAQDEWPEALRNRFREYQVQHLKEKCLLQTDRSIYLSGETLWFSVRIVNGWTNQPLNLSKVVYVELLQGQHRSPMQAAISIWEASGSGAFYLPPELPSGTYVLRAYTNWMKNDGESSFFERPVTVINSTGNPIPENDAGTLPYRLDIFPESGRPVAELDNRIAFQLKDARGVPCSGTGWLLGEGGDTLLNWNTEQLGLGQFHFTPTYGSSYQLVMQAADNRNYSFPLPPAQPAGFTMQLSTSTGNLQVDMATHAIPDTTPLYIMAHTRGRVTFANRVRMTQGHGRVAIPLDSLATGLSRICLFNASGELLAMRLYFRYPNAVPPLHITVPPARHMPRDSFSLEMDAGTALANTPLTVSVVRTESVEPEGSALQPYLWLQSELTRAVYAPEFYFDEGIPRALRQHTMELLMQVQQPVGFGEFELAQAQWSQPQYVSEYEGMQVLASLRKHGKPVADATLFLVSPGKWGQLRTAVSDANGQLRFVMENYYGGQELQVMPLPGMDTANQVELLSPFYNRYVQKNWPRFDTALLHDPQLIHRLVDLEVRRHFTNGSARRFLIPLDSTPYYGRADAAYRLDDYTRFKTLEEVLREFVKEVEISKVEGHFKLAIYNPATNSVYQTGPLVTIDGFPVFDMDQLMTFDPLNIQRIEIVTQPFALGSVVCNGIVNFITYIGYPSPLPSSARSSTLPYPGLQWPSEYSVPEQESRAGQATDPDFRSLLAWIPTCKTDAQGKVQIPVICSDIPGRYTVRAEGIDANGHPVFGMAQFVVEPSGK